MSPLDDDKKKPTAKRAEGASRCLRLATWVQKILGCGTRRTRRRDRTGVVVEGVTRIEKESWERKKGKKKPDTIPQRRKTEEPIVRLVTMETRRWREEKKKGKGRK